MNTTDDYYGDALITIDFDELIRRNAEECGRLIGKVLCLAAAYGNTEISDEQIEQAVLDVMALAARQAAEVLHRQAD